MKFLSSLPLALLASGVAAQGPFTGQAQIIALHHGTAPQGDQRLDDARLSDRVGCVNAAGQLTANDCAVFTHESQYPNQVYSGAGNCSFFNPHAPVNTGSSFPATLHAWTCAAENGAVTVDDYLYTIASGWAVTPVCNGNLDCVYDVPALPKGDDKLPIFSYGGTTPGYWAVLLAWVPRT